MAKREYVEANKRWLEEKAKEEGVMALPRGIYYKVLKQGDPKGAQPSRRSKFSQPGIPGGSTLIFEVELLGVG